jgi:hypothetical protein
MEVKKIAEKIQKISPNLGNKGDKMCIFTIDEHKAVEQIYELMNDLFIKHKKDPLNAKELEFINPFYQAWYGLTLEEDVLEDKIKEENIDKRKDL